MPRCCGNRNFVPKPSLRPKKKKEFDFTSFNIDEQKILSILQEKNNPMMIDELTIKTGMSPSLLASLLLTLEFSNVVKSLPGKQFALAKN